MKVKSVVKVAVVYYHVETDHEDFPEFRRSEQGNWERHMSDSWEPWDSDDKLEKAFQEYLAGQPQWPGVQGRPLLADGVYHIEYVDDHHVRLTKKESA